MIKFLLLGHIRSKHLRDNYKIEKKWVHRKCSCCVELKLLIMVHLSPLVFKYKLVSIGNLEYATSMYDINFLNMYCWWEAAMGS